MRFLLMTEETIAADMAGAVEQAKDTMGSRFQEIFGSLPSKAVFFGLKALVALLMFLVGRKLISLCVKLVDKSMERGGTELTVKKFVKMLVKAAGYILLVLLILAVVGIQPTAFATVASSVTVALGLALQGSLGNFAGGLLILILKPFKVGDYIIEDSHKNEGKVKSIGLVYTTLVTLDNRVIVVPNGTLANSSMTNVTAQDKRLLELLVGISYEADMKQLSRRVCPECNDFILPRLHPGQPTGTCTSCLWLVWAVDPRYPELLLPYLPTDKHSRSSTAQDRLSNSRKRAYRLQRGRPEPRHFLRQSE